MLREASLISELPSTTREMDASTYNAWLGRLKGRCLDGLQNRSSLGSSLQLPVVRRRNLERRRELQAQLRGRK
jgi:hypothetical protein